MLSARAGAQLHRLACIIFWGVSGFDGDARMRHSRMVCVDVLLSGLPNRLGELEHRFSELQRNMYLKIEHQMKMSQSEGRDSWKAPATPKQEHNTSSSDRKPRQTPSFRSQMTTPGLAAEVSGGGRGGGGEGGFVRGGGALSVGPPPEGFIHVSVLQQQHALRHRQQEEEQKRQRQELLEQMRKEEQEIKKQQEQQTNQWEKYLNQSLSAASTQSSLGADAGPASHFAQTPQMPSRPAVLQRPALDAVSQAASSGGSTAVSVSRGRGGEPPRYSEVRAHEMGASG